MIIDILIDKGHSPEEKDPFMWFFFYKFLFDKGAEDLQRKIHEKDDRIKLLEERQEDTIYQRQLDSVNKSQLYINEKCKITVLSLNVRAFVAEVRS